MEKALFKYDFEYHRCVIPARGFYEWNQKKEKYIVQYQNQKQDEIAPIMYFAGVYHRQPGLDTFAIITREAIEEAAIVHDRMPLLIKEKDIARWLSSRKDAMELLSNTSYDKDLRICREETEAFSYQIELEL
jgi:putative SOS response-associated peptidase YedK